MRLNRQSVSTKKREDAAILHLPKLLLGPWCASFLMWAMPGNLVAQDLTPPAAASDAQPPPDNSTTPVNPQSSDNSQTTDNTQSTDNTKTQTSNTSQNPNTQQTPGTPQAPSNIQTPGNPPVINGPLLPQQGISTYSPLYASGANAQSSPLTTPVLNATGAYDLSQIATNAALLQAFGEQAAGGGYTPESEQPVGPINRILLGPFNLKVALTMNVLSDDNLTASAGGPTKIHDTDLSVTPALLLQYGAQEGQKGSASLVYAPTLTRYFHYSSQNSDNQNVAFNAQYPLEKLTLDVSQTYAQVTGINQDLNARTTQTNMVTTGGGNYDVNDKLSFASHFQQLDTSFSQGQGQGDDITSVNSSLAYHFSEKITLGPNLNVGWESPQGGVHQTFQQALMGVNYQPTDKISLFGQGGTEFRQYDQGGDTTNPIFNAGVNYAPFDYTKFAVNAYQTVQPSTADSAQTSVTTGVGCSATQRILQKFELGFSFSYSNSEYQTNTGSPVQSGGVVLPGNNSTTVGSTQDNYVYRTSLSYAPTGWTSVAIYYQYLENKSTTPGAGYHDNQMGISVSAQF
jgi:hypothetical protein